MKKLLLLASVALLGAGSAMAQEDVTPAAYKFYQAETLVPIYPYGVHGANIQAVNMGNGAQNLPGTAESWNVLKAGDYYKDGLLIIGGGQYHAGQAASFDYVKSGIQLLDLGGTIGKVFALNGNGSQIKEVLKAKTGTDYNVTAYGSNANNTVNWGNLNFFLDPKGTPTASANKLQVKIVYNVFSNVYSTTDNAINNIHFKNMENGTRPEGVAFGAWTLGDCFTENPETEDMEWDPAKWCEYTFVADCPDNDESGKTYQPMRICMNFPAQLNNRSILIREISVTAISKDAAMTNKESRNYITLTPGTPAGVNAIVAEGEEVAFNVNGQTVTFSAPATVYNMSGAQVAAGTEVTLSNGMYIARVGAKAVKFVVK